MKLCIRCEVKKEEREFTKDKNRFDGLYPYCKECRKVNDREYKKENRKLVNKLRMGHYYRHREESLAKQKEYRKNNKDKFRIYYLNHTHRRRKQMGCAGTVRPLTIKEILSQQDNRCYYCKNEFENFHIDHLIPLAKGGLHKEYNIVLACPKCNIRKSAKMPDEFIKSIAV